MNCEVTRRWLDAYLDGELELTQQLTFLPVPHVRTLPRKRSSSIL
jgi:hypothetical protein